MVKTLVVFSTIGLLTALAFAPAKNVVSSAFAGLDNSWSPKINAQTIVVNPTQGAANTQNGTLNFSKNQLILKINDSTKLSQILNNFEFKLIDDGKIPEAPSGLVKPGRKLADFPYYVVEITNPNNENIKKFLNNKDVNQITFDSNASAVTFALSRKLSGNGIDGVYLNQDINDFAQRIEVNPVNPIPTSETNQIDVNINFQTPYYNTDQWQKAIDDWANGIITNADLQNVENFLRDFWNRFVNWTGQVNNEVINLVADFNRSVENFVSTNQTILTDFVNNTTNDWSNNINNFLNNIQTPVINIELTPSNPPVNNQPSPLPVVVPVPVNNTNTIGDVNFVEEYVLPDSKTINEAINKTDLKKNTTSIAVIDYGFDLSNPDLTGENKLNTNSQNTQLAPVGYDFGCKNYIQKGSTTKDAEHGTEVASIILGAAGNDYGVAGVAQNAQLIALRAGAACESSELHIWNVIKSVRTANAWGADVINMSFGFNSTKTPSVELLQNVITEARNSGSIVVAAGGNFGQKDGKKGDELLYPANMSGVIAVGGVMGQDDKIIRNNWSNYGNGIDIWASGVLPVTLTNKDNCYNIQNYGCTRFLANKIEGTSFSAALVSGVIATLKQVEPTINEEKLMRVINNSGKTVEGETGKMVDLKGAVTELLKQNSMANNTNAINVNQKQEEYNISLFGF